MKVSGLTLSFLLLFFCVLVQVRSQKCPHIPFSERCVQGASLSCASASNSNPNGCICLPGILPSSRTACVQSVPCSELTSNVGNFCRMSEESGPGGLDLPDPSDPCYTRGGQCLKSCCSETSFLCYFPCSVNSGSEL